MKIVVSNCYFCKGKTKIKKVDVDFRWGDKLFVVKDVPVEVCAQCGEKYYSAEISKKLDDIVKKNNQSKLHAEQIIKVPVFTWQ